jgi:integrase
MDPGRRALIVTTGGEPITKSGFDSTWQRMITAAIAAGAIAQADRFSLHGLKHRGVTDTTGTRGEKQQASGHRSERMMDVYDHDVPTVQPAGRRLEG